LADVDRAQVERKPGTGARPSDEQTAWREFTQASTAESFCRGWLGIQCRLIPGVLGGAVFGTHSSAGSAAFAPVALWGEASRNPKPLADVAQRALSERQWVVARYELPVGGSRCVRYLIAYPSQANGTLTGAVALDLAPRPEPGLQAALRQLEWGSGWLEVLAHRQASTAQHARTRERLQAVLDLVASALGHERFVGSATAFVTAVATKLDCDRVSVGFVRSGRVRVCAVSHTAHIGKRTNLVRAIGAAMDEAIDQKAPLVYPAPRGAAPRVTRAHEDMVHQQGTSAILTVPFAEGMRLVGALTLERPADRPFDGTAAEFAEAVAALVGPMLEVRRRDDRWLVTKALDTGRRHLGHLVGPRHIALKLGVVAVAAVVAFLALAKGEYRVSSRAVMEAGVRRAAVAPFNGYIREAPARAGDLVRQGQLLAALDDREMRLELVKLTSQQDQLIKQQRQALATRNAAQIAITDAQIDQARAQLTLVDDQLAKTRIVAGFDGVVVLGDLSQSLGSPVEKGQVLFEVAPLDAYRVVLQVDERDIADVAVGQRGPLLLAATPDAPLTFAVEKITPVSTAREGRNYFRVEAKLDRTPERLRPGMEGVGKIAVNEQLLVRIWTRSVIDWVRLTVWTWTP